MRALEGGGGGDFDGERDRVGVFDPSSPDPAMAPRTPRNRSDTTCRCKTQLFSRSPEKNCSQRFCAAVQQPPQRAIFIHSYCELHARRINKTNFILSMRQAYKRAIPRSPPSHHVRLPHARLGQLIRAHA
ncbi:hypothetical protein GUJ93_ZPchr0015g6824 [Zizania palustris]|uniref:Uncharacterized protein n=1 Tax=Zizania palustris TaxID=103762 RepID=A0A8J5TI55_ZIZPA|nr:hypothetical protein GUJ93_ZPchr0015g6824 [Zizania palustris]